MLDILLENGLTASDIGMVLLAYPQAFQLCPQRHAAPVLEFLKRDVGLRPGEVRELLARFPCVLGMSVKAHLMPQLAYLRSLGVSGEGLPRLVLSRPLVLGPGIDTVTSFLQRAGLPRSALHRLLASYPIDYRVHFRGFSAVGSGREGGRK